MSEKVYGSRCTACGKVSYPGRAVCPVCGGEEFEAVAAEGARKVLTYTDVYALAIVEFEGELRATGQPEDPAPQIGKRVRATIGTVRQVGDRGIEGLIFVPA